jgi:hypothetical protein
MISKILLTCLITQKKIVSADKLNLIPIYDNNELSKSGTPS